MRDEMPQTELQANLSAVIDVCDAVFPKGPTNEEFALYRTYRSQVVGPPMDVVELVDVWKAFEVISRVGNFLLNEGEVENSQRFYLHALLILSGK
jgi:hypothetical protein